MEPEIVGKLPVEVVKVECPCFFDFGFDVFFDSNAKQHYFKCRSCGKTYTITQN